MSMKKASNNSSGMLNQQNAGPKFIKESVNQKSRSEHNQSFDASFNKSVSYAPTFSNQSRMKSYSQQANILDELEEENFPKTINVNIQRKPSQLKLQQELQKMLSKCINGQQLQIEDMNSIIVSIEECIQESLLFVKQKDFEIQTLRQTYETQLYQKQSTILALENEVSELRQILSMQGDGDYHNNSKLQQLEQENEMLKLQNQQAIKLAVQNRSKKQEKDILEICYNRGKTSNTKPQVNNYSILLNQQYNKIYQQDKKLKSQLF